MNNTGGRENRNKVILDVDTGEFSEIRAGDRIVRKSSIDAFKSKKDEVGFEEWEMKHFYKGNIDEIRSTMKLLDVYEKAFLYSIATYIGYEDCCLKYDNGNEIKAEALIDISGISKGKLYSVLASLAKKDIIYRGKNSKSAQIFVNPWLFCKGPRINKVLKTMFRNYKIQIKNGVMWQDLKE